MFMEIKTQVLKIELIGSKYKKPRIKKTRRQNPLNLRSSRFLLQPNDSYAPKASKPCCDCCWIRPRSPCRSRWSGCWSHGVIQATCGIRAYMIQSLNNDLWYVWCREVHRKQVRTQQLAREVWHRRFSEVSLFFRKSLFQQQRLPYIGQPHTITIWIAWEQFCLSCD